MNHGARPSATELCSGNVCGNYPTNWSLVDRFFTLLYTVSNMVKTLDDIAKLAGVNPSTVSRTINNPEKVKLKTRQKIEAIIDKVGYRPNFFAQGLMKGSTDSVGLLTSIHANPYFMEIIAAIEHALVPDGTYMYLCNCENSIELEKKYLDELIRRKIDGLFVVETPSLNTKQNLYVNSRFDCPVIFLNQHTRSFGDNYVVRCNQAPGIMEVFNEVRQRRLYPFVLLTPAEKSYSYLLKERLFKKWQRQYRLDERCVRHIKLANFYEPNNEQSFWSSYETAKKLLAEGGRPRSILAGNDLMAQGVLIAAHETGIAVPEELSIAGVDNTFISRISRPALSTIDLRMEKVGTLAAQLYQGLKMRPHENYKRVQSIPSLFCRRGTF